MNNIVLMNELFSDFESGAVSGSDLCQSIANRLDNSYFKKEAAIKELDAANAKIDRLTSRGIEDMKYQLDLQKKYLLESAAQINGLNYSLAMLTSAATNNTGNEPSISLYQRALDEAHEALAKTRAQSLRTIQAQAVTDLITECSYSGVFDGVATSIIYVDSAIKYADKLGEG